MKPVFMDTMGWYSLLDRRDAWHARSQALMRELGRNKSPLVTTDYVVDETATLLMVRGASRALDAFFKVVNDSAALTLAMISQPLFREAGAYFLKHRDQGYSFTDVTSFLVMRELRISNAFTHDEHFERAGFARLLAP
ncbi:MAG: type II toxin-antitoxin system VapC family toxin [Terrimicrobiaceae bacterium]